MAGCHINYLFSINIEIFISKCKQYKVKKKMKYKKIKNEKKIPPDRLEPTNPGIVGGRSIHSATWQFILTKSKTSYIY